MAKGLPEPAQEARVVKPPMSASISPHGFSIAKEMRLDLAVPGGQWAQPNPIAGLAQLNLWLTCPPAQFAEPGDEPRDILD